MAEVGPKRTHVDPKQKHFFYKFAKVCVCFLLLSTYMQVSHVVERPMERVVLIGFALFVAVFLLIIDPLWPQSILYIYESLRLQGFLWISALLL